MLGYCVDGNGVLSTELGIIVLGALAMVMVASAAAVVAKGDVLIIDDDEELL